MPGARPRTHTIADSLTTDEPLLFDQRFMTLFAKAETHQRKFRPKETRRLLQAKQLGPVLLERTKSCWEILKTVRERGMTLQQAEEEALPIILVPDENEQP
jgi:hypothetical protein